MVKLLICEDEELIREGLSELEWHNFGIELIGTAENGDAGFVIAKEKLPDIILSDIRMPKKDGIWLAEQIAAFIPNARMIFLTGYNEVEYLKKAISLNVFEYILKPIDEEILFETVLKLKNIIEQKKKNEIEIKEFKNILNESKYFLKNWFVNSIKDSKSSMLHFFGITEKYTQFSSLAIKFSQQESTEYDTFIFFKEIKNILDNSIAFYENDILTFILKFNNNIEEMTIEKHLYQTAERIKEYLDETCSRNYTIGIGFIANEISKIPTSIISAETALQYDFYLGQNQFIYIKDVENKDSASSNELLNDYLNAIKVGNAALITRLIIDLFNGMKANGTDFDEQKRTCLELIVYTSRAIHEIGQDPKILFYHTDVWAVLNRCKSENELFNLIEGMSQVVISQIQEERKTKNDSIIAKVKEIVNKEYDYGASLDSIASKVYLSPCYLSVIFSKEMNMTFKDYLIQVRVEKAKELLETTEMKVYDIALKVGYSDARYFSSLFRRLTGLTPSQYRTNLLGKPNLE